MSDSYFKVWEVAKNITSALSIILNKAMSALTSMNTNAWKLYFICESIGPLKNIEIGVLFFLLMQYSSKNRDF